MQKTIQAQAMYDYSHNLLIANEKIREAYRLRYILTIVAAVSVILLMIFAYFIVRHRNALKLQEERYNYEMEKLAQAQADLLALSSEQSTQDNLLRQKEQEIKTLMEVSKRLRQKIHTLQGYALNERLQQAPVTVRLRNGLMKNPCQQPTHDDWRDLKILINHEIPTFYGTLNVEGNHLNGFEYDVCILLRLHISPASIAKLKNCSAAYITNVRKSIYKKLFKKEGLAEELDAYIRSLS